MARSSKPPHHATAASPKLHMSSLLHKRLQCSLLSEMLLWSTLVCFITFILLTTFLFCGHTFWLGMMIHLLLVVCAITCTLSVAVTFVVLLFQETHYRITEGELLIFQRGCGCAETKRIPLAAITLVSIYDGILDGCFGSWTLTVRTEKFERIVGPLGRDSMADLVQALPVAVLDVAVRESLIAPSKGIEKKESM